MKPKPSEKKKTAKPEPVRQSDPKAIHAEKKPQMQLIPPTFEEQLARALECGADKYGAWNWRENEVEAMTYVGAIKRHLAAFVSREDVADDSKVHHLAHVAASCAILLDAMQAGMLIDNRPTTRAKEVLA